MTHRQMWVRKTEKKHNPGTLPSSSTSAESNRQNSDPSGETYRACNDDGLVGHCGLMKITGKMSAYGSIPNNFDGGSASHHRPMHDNLKNSTLNTRKNELVDDTSVETQGPGCLKNVQKDNPMQGTRFDPKGKSVNTRGGIRLGKTENADEGNTENTDKGKSLVEVRTSEKLFNSEESSQEKTNINGQTKDSVFCFDICPLRSGSGVKLKAPLLLKNRELRKENSRNSDGLRVSVLKPGMILLKNYISLKDQVKVIRKCRELGLGPGGFYLPGYEDGAKLKLKMMCLGKNWDPETGTYGEKRPCDEAKPPLVPEEFRNLVKKAIEECHSHLMNHCRKRNVEHILPSMTPDICIVNFYTKTGRLGLHQDKDESQESLRKGLPVVSFSIGDSAEFLYGEERNVDKVDKIFLESGDVLIFGGKSRHIYHGVSTIFPDTAPTYLLEEANLRSGRLNLTFREY